MNIAIYHLSYLFISLYSHHMFTSSLLSSLNLTAPPHPRVNQARVDLVASQARADQVASRARAVEIPLQVVIGVSLVSQVMTGAHHPAVNRARVAQARASQERVEGPQAQETGVHQVLLTGALQEIGEVAHHLPPQERAARVDQDVNLVRAVRAVAPQVLQMIKDGESHVRVGVLPRRPLVNQARAAVVRVNRERVAVPQARQAVHGRLMDGVDGVQTLARHPAVNLARVIQEGEARVAPDLLFQVIYLSISSLLA